MLLGFAALVAGLPTLVTCGPWRDTVLNLGASGLNGKVSTGDFSIGWFTPLTASDIRVVDAHHQPVVTIRSLTSDKSLLGMLAGLNDLGRITVAGLDADLVLREDGSNVEDLVANWMQEPPSGKTSNIRFDLNLTDGRVSIQDLSSRQQCTIEQLALHAAGSTDLSQKLDASIEGNIRYNGRSGPLTVKIASQPNGSGAPGPGSMTMKVADFPLAVCQAIVCRKLPHSQLAGLLSVNLNCQATANDEGQLSGSAEGQLEIAKLVAGGACFSGDRLVIRRLTIPCQAAFERTRLDIRRLEIDSDVGQVSLQGTLAQSDKAAAIRSIADLIDALNGSSGSMEGKLDLAKLARLLPNALGLKSGVEVTTGSLAWQVDGKDVGGKPTYSGTLDASNIEAKAEGRKLSWKSPLHASFAAHGEGQTAVLDQLACQSDFAQLSGHGNLKAITASGKYDLGKLCDQLGQFIELGSRRIDGQGDFKVDCQRDSSGRFTAASQFNLKQLQLLVDGNPWIDQAWALKAQLKGQWPSGMTWRVDSATLSGQFGGDQVSLTLTKPVIGPLAKCSLPITLHTTGQASTWIARAQALGGVQTDAAIAGEIDLQASATCWPTLLVVDSAVLTCQPLEFRCGQNRLAESEARIEASGRLDLAARRASGWNVEIQTNSFSTELADGTFSWPAGQPAASARVAFAGDLARMQTSFGIAGNGLALAGTINGNGSLQQTGSQSVLDLTAGVENLIVGTAPGQAVAAGKVAMALAGNYDRAADRLQVSKCSFSSNLAQLEASGTIQNAGKNPLVDLSGHCEYDLQKLTALLQLKFGPNIQLAGRESRSFRLKGPLLASSEPATPSSSNPPSAASLLSGEASLGWDSANVYGFNLGPATLSAQFDHGMLRLVPAQLSVNGGHINVAGQVQPLSPAGVFTLPPGVVVDHVQIAEKLGHPSLKFILPMASQSEVQGEISVTLTNCQFPMAAPEAADVSGQLTIHQLQMTRGPFMRELAGLLRHNETAELAANSVVPFRLVQGRIYHEGLELKLHEVTVQTYGSVGLDQSLAIMAELPVPLSWLPEGLATGQFKDKTIRVPIGGTLAKPQIDHKEVERLAGQFVRNAGENVIRNGIAKPLERLLGPR